jgi:hypothetical protein
LDIPVNTQFDYLESEEDDNDGECIIPGRRLCAPRSPVANGNCSSVESNEVQDKDSSSESEEEEETAGVKSTGLVSEETHSDEELSEGSPLDFCDEIDDSDAEEYDDDEDDNESTTTALIQSRAMVETAVKWCSNQLSRP